MLSLLGAWAFAALAAAVLAHALIGAAGTFAGGDADAYDARAHVAVIPVAVAMLALLAAFTGWIAAVVAARRSQTDPVRLIARRFGGLHSLLAVAAVSGGALTTLLGMEFAEQLVAAGRIEGVADALGGSPILGAALLLGAAAAVTLLGLRVAAGCVAVAAAATLVVLQALRRSLCRSAATPARRAFADVPRRLGAAFAFAHGVRGPPPAA